MPAKVQHPLAKSSAQGAPPPIGDAGKRPPTKPRGKAASAARGRKPAKPAPAIPLDFVDEDGNTGLHRAVLQEQPMYITDAAVHAGTRNKEHKTALHLAAERGDFAAIEHLVALPEEVGVRVDAAVTYKGFTLWKPTALMILAVLHHRAQYVQGEGEPPRLHRALCTLATLESGKRNWSGHTALMYACMSRNTLLAEHLVSTEAGLQAKGGWTALMFAAQFGHLALVSKLLRKEYGLQNAGGWTALMDAANNGHLEIVHLLAPKERGMTTKKGRTALMMAVRAGNYEAASLLLRESGRRDCLGYTALMYAVQSGSYKLTSLLGPLEGAECATEAMSLLKESTAPEIRERYALAMRESGHSTPDKSTGETASSTPDADAVAAPCVAAQLNECTDPDYLLADVQYHWDSVESSTDASDSVKTLSTVNYHEIS